MKKLCTLILFTLLLCTKGWSQAPANDDCSGAIELSCSTIYSGNTTNATDENLPAGSSYPGQAVTRGIWFKYTATKTDIIQFALDHSISWSPLFREYTGSCDSLHFVNSTTVDSHIPYMTFSVTAGITYYILLTGINTNDFGAYTITSNCQCTTNIITQPVGASYCQNQPAIPLSITTIGYVYYIQWYSNTVNSTEDGIPVDNSSIYSCTPSTAAAQTTYYYAVVLGDCYSDTSAVVAVHVGAPITSATLAAQQTTICYGSQIQLTASAQSTNKSFTYNFINTNNNSSTGYISSKSKSEPAGIYVVAVKNSGGCIDTSNAVTITQPALPIAVTTAITNGVCGGKGSVQISASGGYSNFVYTISGSSIVGKTTPYTFSYLPQGKYTITAIDAQGCPLTRNITIGNTTKVPSPTGFAGPTTVTANSTQVYHIDSTDNVSYTWAVPSDASVIAGQGTTTATIQWGYKAGKIKITPSSSCGKGAATQYSIIVTHTTLAKTTATKINTDAGTHTISVHPNPVSNITTLVLNSKTGGKYAIDVTDITGKTLLRKEVILYIGRNDVKLDVTPFANGLYLIKVWDGKTIQSLKLVKE